MNIKEKLKLLDVIEERTWEIIKLCVGNKIQSDRNGINTNVDLISEIQSIRKGLKQ